MRRYASATLKALPDGTLAFSFNYDPGMVAALKSQIPYTGRAWDGARKRWLVDIQYEGTCRALALQFLNVNLSPVQQALFHTELETRLLTLRYLGKAKPRGSGEATALGHDGTAWAQIYPISVLKTWFNIPHAPGSENTFYGVLGISNNAPELEIKKAFKKMARIWHPDVCDDPDATEQFQKINEANMILSNPGKRARYDAGLALESGLTHGKGLVDDSLITLISIDGWRPPLRCGYLLVEGKMRLNRFVVSKIIQWTDIVNSAGQVLQTSWKYGDTLYSEKWV